MKDWIEIIEDPPGGLGGKRLGFMLRCARCTNVEMVPKPTMVRTVVDVWKRFEEIHRNCREGMTIATPAPEKKEPE